MSLAPSLGRGWSVPIGAELTHEFRTITKWVPIITETMWNSTKHFVTKDTKAVVGFQGQLIPCLFSRRRKGIRLFSRLISSSQEAYRVDGRSWGKGDPQRNFRDASRRADLGNVELVA